MFRRMLLVAGYSFRVLIWPQVRLVIATGVEACCRDAYLRPDRGSCRRPRAASAACSSQFCVQPDPLFKRTSNGGMGKVEKRGYQMAKFQRIIMERVIFVGDGYYRNSYKQDNLKTTKLRKQTILRVELCRRDTDTKKSKTYASLKRGRNSSSRAGEVIMPWREPKIQKSVRSITKRILG